MAQSLQRADAHGFAQLMKLRQFGLLTLPQRCACDVEGPFGGLARVSVAGDAIQNLGHVVFHPPRFFLHIGWQRVEQH
jgi:hypothetical protein